MTQPDIDKYATWFEKGISIQDEQNLRRAQYLWNEYQYRHDHNWRLVFRLTAAVVILAIIPYAQPEVTRVLKWWTLAPPVLGIVLAIVGLIVIKNETRLLNHIRRLYRPLQDSLTLPYHGKRPSTFNRNIWGYVAMLAALSVLNAILLALEWIPRQLTEAP